MNKKLFTVLLVSGISAGSMTACTWVEPTIAAEQVKVVAPANVTHCKKIGAVTVEVKADLVLGLQRDPEKVAGELAVLGRNHAAKQGADSIVPAGAVVNGTQKFDTYRCAQ